jgi:hypothetical protein
MKKKEKIKMTKMPKIKKIAKAFWINGTTYGNGTFSGGNS